MDDLEEGHGIELYIYDLTKGISSMVSELFLGRKINGIWHTSVIAYGKENFFGSSGIQSCLPGGTILGQPLKIERIGNTSIPYPVFRDYLRGLADSTFRPTDYNLLQHNCNTFSDELCQFLCGKGIPKYILDLPQEFLSTQLGQTLAPLFDSIGQGLNSIQGLPIQNNIQNREQSPGYQDLISEVEQARVQSAVLDEKRRVLKDKIDKKEKKKDKKDKKKNKSHRRNSNSNSGMSDIDPELNGGVAIQEIPSEMLPSEHALEEEAREKREEEEKKRQRDPPVVFADIDAKAELEALVTLIDGKLSPDEEQSMMELHQYLLEGEGAWAISEGFLVFVGRILRDSQISTETRVHLLRAMAAAALKDDVILLLHQDRRDHIIMNFAQDIDKHKPEEQQALALLLCNLFENTSSSEWLLYISEWAYNNQQTSNIRATTKVSVHCLLAPCPTLQDFGTALIHNLACKEKFHHAKTLRQMLPQGTLSKVFDDIAVELTMALLQFFNSKPSEEFLFRTMKALSRFVTISPEVPQFVQMIGPDPKIFRGTSERIDHLIDLISKKVR